MGHPSQRGIRAAHEVNSRYNQTTLGGASLRFLQGRGFFWGFGSARLWGNSKREGKRSRKQIPAFGKRHAYGGQASRCPKYGRVRGGFALARIRGHKKRRERFLGFARNDRRMQDAGLKDAAT